MFTDTACIFISKFAFEADQLSRYSLFFLKISCDFWKVLCKFTNNVVKKSHKKNKSFVT